VTGRSIAETARVTLAWTASYTPALRVVRGEPLTAGGTDPDNPGWRWCVNAEGLGGWLPEGLVVEGRASMAFDSVELTVRCGDLVTLLETHAGWWLCRHADGRVGWVPDANLARTG